MPHSVYANGQEISAKSSDGKSIASFPDVCFTPPQAPPTPAGVPIPYPNTGMAKDTTNGTRTIKINGKEVMLKDQSYYKTSYGNEAGCTPKKGIITAKIKGKIYFTSWSMNVKFEGKNVVRHLDLTTHNHGSFPANTPPIAHISSMDMALQKTCEKEIENSKSCIGQDTETCSDECKTAQTCLLVPKGQDKTTCCAPHTTGHHMIEDHWVKGEEKNFPMAQGSNGYNGAPCVCANRFRSPGTVHRAMHDIQGTHEESYMPGGARHDPTQANGGWNYAAGKAACLDAHAEVFKSSACSRDCLEAQLDNYYGNDGQRPLTRPEKQAIGSERQALAEIYAPAKPAL